MAKIKSDDLAMFFENLAFMVEADIDILSAVSTLRDIKTPSVRKLASALQIELQKGKDLAQAVYTVRKLIGKDFSPYISAGLSSGTLHEVLRRLADALKQSGATKRQVQSALIYPVFLLLLTICASIYMFTNLVPQMAVNIKELSGGELPNITQTVLSLSEFFISNKLTIVVLIIVLAAFIKLLSKIFARHISKAIIKLPLVGKLIIAADLTEFYANLSNLIYVGMTNIEAISICVSTVKSKYMKNKLQNQVIAEMTNGKSLSEAVKKVDFISAVDKQCIKVAENTGNLSELFASMAERSKIVAQQTTKTLLSFIEPMMLITMGAIIASIVFAVYMPMLKMTAF